MNTGCDTSGPDIRPKVVDYKDRWTVFDYWEGMSAVSETKRLQASYGR